MEQGGSYNNLSDCTGNISYPFFYEVGPKVLGVKCV
jgi:hypothetical protein